MKKAQITVFIIIAIVLIVAGAAIYYLNSTSKQSDLNRQYFEQADVRPMFDQLKTDVLDCVDDSVLASLELVGIQGGYYNEPPEFFDLGWAFIPYYYNKGKFLMPTKETIEAEIAASIDENLILCINDIAPEDFDLDYKASVSTVSIKEDEVEFKIDMPISISREDKTTVYEIKEIPVIKESKINEMIEIADYITESHRDDPEMICISCITDMAIERELFVDMLDFGEEYDTLVVISHNETTAPFAFEFLNGYPAPSEALAAAPAP